MLKALKTLINNPEDEEYKPAEGKNCKGKRALKQYGKVEYEGIGDCTACMALFGNIIPLLAPCSNKQNYSSMDNGDSQENHAIKASNKTQRQ
jgi:hypothetical protein